MVSEVSVLPAVVTSASHYQAPQARGDEEGSGSLLSAQSAQDTIFPLAVMTLFGCRQDFEFTDYVRLMSLTLASSPTASCTAQPEPEFAEFTSGKWKLAVCAASACGVHELWSASVMRM